jgi:mannose-6-phosphate isomerase-like protein (cupin superfamily)
MVAKLNLTDAFASFQDTWSPRVAAQIDDFAMKIVKVQGEFVWHHHDDAEELFLVHRGQLTLRFRDREDVVLDEGELYVIPRRVEHMPVSEAGCEVILLERADLANTGSAGGERTVAPQPLSL